MLKAVYSTLSEKLRQDCKTGASKVISEFHCDQKTGISKLIVSPIKQWNENEKYSIG